MRSLAVIILAAGKGTRMGGDIPKVCHELDGKPLIAHVLEAIVPLAPQRVILVVGYRAEAVAGAVRAYSELPIEFIRQEEQRGTGHAVSITESLLKGFDGDVLIRYGDTPLIRSETLARLFVAHRKARATGALLTALLDNPTGYGRIVRNASGRVVRIEEEKSATEEEREIREINAGAYCYRARALFSALKNLRPNSANGEYYLTDAVRVLTGRGRSILALPAALPEEVLGVNTPEQLRTVSNVRASLFSGRSDVVNA
ncbi:MAG: NTP transferase domain-containing protein [bacterium]|nr:NTP transferase domain-containing protein [bacterium]MDZ4284980.1 NTP transferase domain-containing protein [Patescibacteria group bacterium]